MRKARSKENQFTPGRIMKAYKAATAFFGNRNPDGSLPKQQAVAKKLGLNPARLSEFLQVAWAENIIDVIITPPRGISGRDHVLREMEAKLLKKLEPFSPPLVDKNGRELREHKLLQIHVVSGGGEGMPFDSSNGRIDPVVHNHVMERVCRRAADEFYSLLKFEYEKMNVNGYLYCGIGWSQTCKQTVSLMRLSTDYFSNLVVCPLIGIIGHKFTSLDANALATTLANALSGTSTKIPFPALKPPDLDISRLRSVSRALEDVEKCSIGISGIAPAYTERPNLNSGMLARKMIDREQLQELKALRCVAELQGHYFDIHGRHIPTKKIGFVPVGVDAQQMQRMPIFMIVVGPKREKLLPAIVSIKAGICSHLVLEHNMARYILSGKHDEELQLVSTGHGGLSLRRKSLDYHIANRGRKTF